VRAFFPRLQRGSSLKRDIQRFLRGLREIYPGIDGATLRWTVLKERNWNSSWRRFFPLQRIGARFWVTPPWLDPPPLGRKVITIEPGMAFGTGTHPTTRCCLEFVEEVASLTEPDEVCALDLGTGSGILAIALAKLGVKKIWALDNDPVALEVAKGNIKRNRCPLIHVSSTSLDRLRRCFTLIVANLTAETIVELAPRLKEHLTPGGFLVLSGILNPKVPSVLSGFKGFRPVRQVTRRGWTTLLLRKAA
jgi:ribosomal protein L11 methyltransferase